MIAIVFVIVPVVMKPKKIMLKNKVFYYYKLPYVKSLILDKDLSYLIDYPQSLFSICSMLFIRYFNHDLYKSVTHFLSKKCCKKKILTTWIHLTNKCTLCCSYCYLDHNNTSMTRETIDKVVKSLQKEIKENSSIRELKIKISGGESLMSLDKLKYLVYRLGKEITTDVKLTFAILSNGTFTNKEIISFIKNNDIKLMVSLDGVDKYHNKHRKFVDGKGSFNSVKKSIIKYLDNDIIPDISAVITSENISGLPDLLRFINLYDLPISLNLVKTDDSNLQVRFVEFKKYWKCSLPELKILARRLGFMGNFVDQLILGYTREYACLAGKSYLVFNCDGRVYRCQHDYSKSVAKVDEGKLLEKIQRRLDNSWNSNNIDEISRCKDCDIKYFCSGGCPIVRADYGGSLSGSEYCKIYKFVFNEILTLLDEI